MDSAQCRHQEQVIRKRVACEEKAFHVVLRLLENPIVQDYLCDAGQLISPAHYADVVEERSIEKLCGYPLCSKTLGTIPKQKYKISTKTNMVYDITERKKFCSNFCLKASQFFEKQISTSPVWARENEARVDFEFLDRQPVRCSMGDEVMLTTPWSDLEKEVKTLERLDKLKSKNVEKRSSETSDNSCLVADVTEDIASMKITDVSQVDGINLEFSNEPADEDKHKDNNTNTASEDSAGSKTDGKAEHHEANTITELRDVSKTEEKVQQKSCKTPKQAEFKGQMQDETTQDYVRRLLDRKKNLLGQLADIQESVSLKKMPAEVPESGDVGADGHLVDSDEEEESVNTVKIIHPSEKQSPALTLKRSSPSFPAGNTGSDCFGEPKEAIQSPKSSDGTPIKVLPLQAVATVIEAWVTRDTLKYFEVAKIGRPANYEENYSNLCKNIAEQNREFDRILEDDSKTAGKAPKKSVPDFKDLEAQTKEYQLRVREFLKGSYGPKKKNHSEVAESSSASLVQLPTVDSHDQMVIRRKIVLDRLDKVMPDLLTALRLSIQDVSHLLRELVYTFSFGSDNILFKPGEWTLVGIILMKMITLKSKTIGEAFKEQAASRYFSILLSGIGHKLADLDDIVTWLICADQDR